MVALTQALHPQFTRHRRKMIGTDASIHRDLNNLYYDLHETPLGVTTGVGPRLYDHFNVIAVAQGNEADSLLDLTENGLDGTKIGTPAFTIGSGWNFEGATGHVKLNNSSASSVWATRGFYTPQVYMGVYITDVGAGSSSAGRSRMGGEVSVGAGGSGFSPDPVKLYLEFDMSSGLTVFDYEILLSAPTSRFDPTAPAGGLCGTFSSSSPVECYFHNTTHTASSTSDQSPNGYSTSIGVGAYYLDGVATGPSGSRLRTGGWFIARADNGASINTIHALLRTVLQTYYTARGVAPV